MHRFVGISIFALSSPPRSSWRDSSRLPAKTPHQIHHARSPQGKHEGASKSHRHRQRRQGRSDFRSRSPLDIDMNSLFSDSRQTHTHLKFRPISSAQIEPEVQIRFHQGRGNPDDGYKVTGDFTMLGKPKSISPRQARRQR